MARSDMARSFFFFFVRLVVFAGQFWFVLAGSFSYMPIDNNYMEIDIAADE